MDILTLWFLFVALPTVAGWGKGFIIVSVFGLLCATFFRTVQNAEEKEEYPLLVYIKSFSLTLVLGFIFSLSPDEKQVAMIAGGYVVTNAESVAELPDNIMNAANRYLESLNVEDISHE